jgi:hypothetical protein
MSETLTYDSAPEGEGLSTEEQNSLEVGEELVAQQEGLLAGKYKDARELEKAYVELQKKLGDPSRDEPEEEVEAEPEEQEESEEEPEKEPTEAVTLITDASNEYAENGTLSKETMEKFQSMSSEELVSAYMEMSSNAPQQQVADLSESEVNSIQKSVGGEEAYAEIVGWAADNLDAETIEAYDTLVNSGNSKAIQLAVAGLKAQYEMSNGYEGEMLTGKAAAKSSSVFRSQAELVEAMADPRYDRDPAYRNDILEKLERSDLNF